ncbi:MAG TPA: DUF938 domain-containing protein [Polyangiaceae bacterium]|nr:DUF938 domain-containing protein [Polyangiaceae bacterium]
MKRHFPAADRNRAPILETLRTIFPKTCRVLEVGSGTGQHAAFFTAEEPGWVWQPTDFSAENVASVEAYRVESGRPNFLPTIQLDARSDEWPEGPFDAVYSANVIHISPWEVAEGLFRGSARVLAPSGVLVLYGPFRFGGTFTADSNAAFDDKLRREDASWGVRDLDDLNREARANGFLAGTVLERPANNHVIVFERARGAQSPR